MILIADSGSTKTHWALIDNQKVKCQFTSAGINPFYQSSEQIYLELQNSFNINCSAVQEIHFYGAGCIGDDKNKIVSDALQQLCINASITINSDLLAAARSLCGQEQGIACILGTGSNSCLYDGKNILENISPLGYIIGDEGSGAVLGKMFMADLLKNQLPIKIRDAFFAEYNYTQADILTHIYKQDFPNRFLAQFTPFIKEHLSSPPIYRIVSSSFEAFVERNLLQYTDVKQHKIHFTGSIAFHFKNILTEVLNIYELQTGKISASPMYGLIQYHQSQLS